MKHIRALLQLIALFLGVLFIIASTTYVVGNNQSRPAAPLPVQLIMV